MNNNIPESCEKIIGMNLPVASRHSCVSVHRGHRPTRLLLTRLCTVSQENTTPLHQLNVTVFINISPSGSEIYKLFFGSDNLYEFVDSIRNGRCFGLFDSFLPKELQAFQVALLQSQLSPFQDVAVRVPRERSSVILNSSSPRSEI